jgi:hypothetical protein
VRALVHPAAVAIVVAAIASVVACAAPAAPAASTCPTASTTAAVVATAPSSASAERSATPTTPDDGGSRVRAGNRSPLNGAAVPFAEYLNAMHNRLHPHFSDEALGKLDALPPSDPLIEKKLSTRVELELDSGTGAIRRLVVVKSSGLASYDAIAVDAVQRAGPFGEADPLIRSADGDVYVHWELARDPVFGCSLMKVRPFLLTDKAPSP